MQTLWEGSGGKVQDSLGCLPIQHSCSPPPDLSPMDGISTCGPKEEVTLRVVVRLPPQHIIKGVRDLGTVTLSFPLGKPWL